MTYEHVFDVLTSRMSDARFTELRILKSNAATIFCFNMRIARIYLGKQVQYIEMFDPGYGVEKVDEVSTNKIAITEDTDWNAVAAIMSDLWTQCSAYPPVDTFGCCHLFIDCSEAKRCLKAEDINSWGCYYKKNLENGKIFYGNNKNIQPVERNGMDFVAIDFETANSSRTSACSLGIAVVQGDEIIETRHWLIKPEPYDFAPLNVAIHGITEADVANAPSFEELWPTVEPYLRNKMVVAHNASFDISVLRRTLEYYGLRVPRMQILCSYNLARKALPSLVSHRLNMVCASLGVPLIHHDAHSDASACANVILSFASFKGIESLDALVKEYEVTTGHISEDDYEPCRARHMVVRQSLALDADIGVVYDDEDFAGKTFVFTGELLSLSRETAITLVKQLGGIPLSGVSKKTNYLVVGIQDAKKLNGHNQSSKMRKAIELKEKGHDIEIIGEDEFYNMVDDEAYAALNIPKLGLSLGNALEI